MPELFGLQLNPNEEVPPFYFRNASLFVFPLLAIYFMWKRGWNAVAALWIMLPFAVGAVFTECRPFNFTAIAGNLPTAPALMGNTVLWKASPTQAATAYLTMQLLKAAGLPAGVINLVFGDGPLVSDVALADPRLAGIHFTGSTATFQTLWKQVGDNLSTYRTYPRLVGETGGKDFVVAHRSADPTC